MVCTLALCLSALSPTSGAAEGTVLAIAYSSCVCHVPTLVLGVFILLDLQLRAEAQAGDLAQSHAGASVEVWALPSQVFHLRGRWSLLEPKLTLPLHAT